MSNCLEFHTNASIGLRLHYYLAGFFFLAGQLHNAHRWQTVKKSCINTVRFRKGIDTALCEKGLDLTMRVTPKKWLLSELDELRQPKEKRKEIRQWNF